MAGEFSSHITFKTKSGEANAKSVLSILGACVKKNDEIELICDGVDEKEALEAISEAIENGFEEQ